MILPGFSPQSASGGENYSLVSGGSHSRTPGGRRRFLSALRCSVVTSQTASVFGIAGGAGFCHGAPNSSLAHESLGDLMSVNSSDKTLLYVEDDHGAIGLFAMATERVGVVFKTQIAKNLEEAFDVLKEQPKPMAILLDYSLGKFSAGDLLRWMRGRPDCAPIEVAILSGLDSEWQVKEAYEAGADYYLVKPSHFPELVEIVERINNGFRRPSKNLFLYQLVGSRAYREPMEITRAARSLRRRTD